MRRRSSPIRPRLALAAASILFAASCGPTRPETDRTTAEKAPPISRRETPAAPPPHVVVEGDPVYRFGIKAQQVSFSRSWVVRNDGEGPLVLEPEPPPCSCVAIESQRLSENADGPNLVIQPGDKSTITLTWKTRDYHGRYRWPLSLVTNDPRRPKLTFLADGIVRPPVAVDPESGVNFSDIYDEDGEHAATIAIYSPDRSDLLLTRMASSRPELLQVRSRPMTPDECRTLEASSGYRLDVVLKPGMPPGSFREGVKIATNHPDRREVSFPVVGRIGRPIAVVPEQLRLPPVRGARGVEVTATLSVRGRRKTEFRVDRKPDRIEVAILPSERPGVYRMQVRIPPGYPRGSIRDAIVLKTDHPHQPEVRIPIEAIVVEGG